MSQMEGVSAAPVLSGRDWATGGDIFLDKSIDYSHPHARAELHESFRYDVDEFGKSLERVNRSLARYSKETTQVENASEELVSRVTSLSEVVGGDDSMEALCSAMQALNSARVRLKSELERTSYATIQGILENDVQKAREIQRQHDVALSEFENAQLRSAQVKRDCTPEQARYMEEEVLEKKRSLLCRRVEIGSYLREIRAKKHSEVRQAIASVIRAHYEYFHNGLTEMKRFVEMCSEIEQAYPATLNEFTTMHKELQTALESVFNAPREDLRHDFATPVDEGQLTYEGYLFKHAKKRRYCIVQNGSFLIYKEGASAPSGELNLLLTTVKSPAAIDARHSFELVSANAPAGIAFSCESGDVLQRWVTVINNNIANLLHAQAPARKRTNSLQNLPRGTMVGWQSVAQNLQATSGNDKCCDCAAPLSTCEWVCINRGTCVCIECSGIHRSLGVHVSKVRSLALDKVDISAMELLEEVGNAQFNVLAAHNAAPGPLDTREQKEAWIKTKYVDRACLNPALKPSDPDRALVDATEKGDAAAALAALAFGASPTARDARGVPALHIAAAKGSLGIMELLVQNGADHSAVDAEGKTALHAAAASGQVLSVTILLRKGLDVSATDSAGKTPADCVAADDEGTAAQLREIFENATKPADLDRSDSKGPLTDSVVVVPQAPHAAPKWDIQRKESTAASIMRGVRGFGKKLNSMLKTGANPTSSPGAASSSFAAAAASGRPAVPLSRTSIETKARKPLADAVSGSTANPAAAPPPPPPDTGAPAAAPPSKPPPSAAPPSKPPPSAAPPSKPPPSAAPPSKPPPSAAPPAKPPPSAAPPAKPPPSAAPAAARGGAGRKPSSRSPSPSAGRGMPSRGPPKRSAANTETDSTGTKPARGRGGGGSVRDRAKIFEKS